MLDDLRTRREFGRWVLLLGLYNARPIGVWEEVLLSIVRSFWADSTQHEVRLALDYLGSRKIVAVFKEPSGRWRAELNNIGVDIVEYVVPCDPGIARPEKY